MEKTQNDPAEQTVFREARKSYSRALLNISLYYVVGILVILLIRHFLPDEPSETAELLSNYIPLYFIALPFYLLISKLLPKTVPEKKKLPAGQFVLAFFCCEFIALAGSFIGAVINLFLTLLIGKNTSSMFLLEGVFGDSSVLFLVIAIIFAPIVEETVFRKVLIDRVRKYGDTTAIVISGLMFGLFHANLSQFFYAAGVGMLLAFIYVRTGKAQYNIMMHMLMNFWGTFLPRLLLRNADMKAFVHAVTSQDIAAMMQLLPTLRPLTILGTINFIIGTIGLVVLITKRSDFRVPPPVAPLPKKQRISAAIFNIGFGSLFAVCIFRFVQQMKEILN